MELDTFINQFEKAIEGLEPGSVAGGSEFRRLEEWDSLAVLTVLAMVDEEYGVQVSGLDLEQCDTVEELYNRIVGKTGSGDD